MGYGSSLYLVSAVHITKWTVSVSSNPLTRVFPRRWLDITGARITEIWEAALKCVVGTVIFRPGIPQTELRWRLRTLYDRQELNDVLRYLCEEGILTIRGPEGKLDPAADRPFEMDESEENDVYWFIGPTKRWYYV
jgi:transcription factor C subunit 3